MKTLKELENWIFSNVDPARIQESEGGVKAMALWFVACAQANEFQESYPSVKDIAWYFLKGIKALDEAEVTEYLQDNARLWAEDAEAMGTPDEFEESLTNELKYHFRDNLL